MTTKLEDWLKKIEQAPHDSNLIKFLTRNISEYAYYSFFAEDLKHVLTIDTVIREPVEFLRMDKGMINYNYRLDFPINRLKLKQVFDLQPNWTARYDPRSDANVTIQIPYDVPEEQKMMRRKQKIHCHTFIVTSSSVVTLSGSSEDLMEEAYNNFMHILMRHQEYISTQ
jgi:hypothetical protein